MLSPDASKIAFSAPNGNDDYALSIWAMDADGKDRTKLTDGTEMACAPAWSPDGTRIAFCDMNFWTGPIKVFVMDADGRNRRELADGVFPFWSADGERIGYAAWTRERGSMLQLRVVDAKGGDSEALVKGGFLMGQWSPDGRQVVYVGADGPEGPNFDLYIADADGTGRRQLTETPEAEFSPQWSVDGKSIYFVRFPAGKETSNFWSLGDGEQAEIHAIDADGRSERRLTGNHDFDFLRGGAFVIGMSHPITPKGGNDFYPPARRSGEQREQND